MALMAGCGMAPMQAPDGAPPRENTNALLPLTPQSLPSDDAPARSHVATVNYGLTTPGTGLSEDGGEPSEQELQRGNASWYGIQFHHRRTANGERFDMGAMTAAHRSLPFNTRVCVRSLVNGREVLVRINDRGPYAAGRIIDLSRAAAGALGMLDQGIKQVALRVMRPQDGGCNTEVADAQEIHDPSPGAPKVSARHPASRALPRQSRK